MNKEDLKSSVIGELRESVEKSLKDKLKKVESAQETLVLLNEELRNTELLDTRNAQDSITKTVELLEMYRAGITTSLKYVDYEFQVEIV